MSLRLRITDALYSAIENDYEPVLVKMSPRQIAEDMQGHDIFNDNEFEKAISILSDMRTNGEI